MATGQGSMMETQHQYWRIFSQYLYHSLVPESVSWHTSLAASGEGLMWIMTDVSFFRKISQKPIRSTRSLVSPWWMWLVLPPLNKAVYNHSIQALNSTELAKKEMYQEMAKVSDRSKQDNDSWLIFPLWPQVSRGHLWSRWKPIN